MDRRTNQASIRGWKEFYFCFSAPKSSSAHFFPFCTFLMILKIRFISSQTRTAAARPSSLQSKPFSRVQTGTCPVQIQSSTGWDGRESSFLTPPDKHFVYLNKIHILTWWLKRLRWGFASSRGQCWTSYDGFIISDVSEKQVWVLTSVPYRSFYFKSWFFWMGLKLIIYLLMLY